MKKEIAVIGGGPAALAFASFVDTSKFDVTIYEKNKALGRKFLVAGDGGFNLTHSENIEQLINRYTPVSFLDGALREFTNNDTRVWLENLGIPTFIGSSKRVYPEGGIKPIQVINVIIDKLKEKGINFVFNKTWTGWNDNELTFDSEESIKADKIVFCLGGGSWKVTGSDGAWLNTFIDQNIETIPFAPANCAYKINLSKDFIQRNAGEPLKNIAASYGKRTQKGELVITEFGIEGNAVYALSSEIQPILDQGKSVYLEIDFKPIFTETEVFNRLEESTFKNSTETLKKGLKLSRVQVDLLKTILTKEQYTSNKKLAHWIKQFKLEVTDSATLDEAISTTGGLCLGEIDSNYQLYKKESNYCIGEMLDWNAPTGGYLLQACFSMGALLANHLNTSSDS
ncbi:MAG: NAD(P)-dependent oxidoreductase [Crocinitomicaceae bacterium]